MSPEDNEIELKENDRLLFYTDGITEAARPDGEEFGQKRLEKTALSTRSLPLDKQLDAVLADVVEFQYTPGSQDDITLIGIQMVKSLLAEESTGSVA